jgi:hypothetical protein
MPSTRTSSDTNPLPTPRRRWWIAATVIAVVLILYAGALTWTTRRLEVDIQKSIHALPDASAGHRDGD